MKPYWQSHLKTPNVPRKAVFKLATLFARTGKKVGTLPTCSRRIFSPANFNQSRCRILFFASRRANKVAKWKIGLRPHSKFLSYQSWKFAVYKVLNKAKVLVSRCHRPFLWNVSFLILKPWDTFFHIYI